MNTIYPFDEQNRFDIVEYRFANRYIDDYLVKLIRTAADSSIYYPGIG